VVSIMLHAVRGCTLRAPGRGRLTRDGANH
jgi:hypothetical protein